MSVSAFRKGYSNKLLKRLDKESKRTSVEGQTGQAIILKDLKAFETIIESSLGKSIPKPLLQTALSNAKQKARELHNNFKQQHKRRYNNIVSRLEDIRVLNHFTLGQDIFIVATFRGNIDSVKKEVLDVLEDSGFLTNNERKDVRHKIHKGHGVAGSAVAEVEVASSLRDVSKEDIDTIGKAFLHFAERAELPDSNIRRVEKLLNSYSQIVTKRGSLSASYVSIIEFQEGSENTGIDSVEEKRVKTTFKSFLNELGGADYLLNLQGSSSLLDKIEKVVIDTFDIEKNLIVTKNAKISKASLKTKGKTKSKGSKYKGSAKISKGGPSPRRSKTTRAKKGVSSAPLFLIGVLNEQLPRVLESNMQPPRLQYQTGRFANSVTVTDIIQTPKGYPSIGYTYMKGPYQTFEPGYAQGSVERDPRRLIDKSIREIAIQYAIGRFYTRRE